MGENSRIIELERQLEQRKRKMQELESKLDWQQQAGDAAAKDLHRTLKILRQKDIEIAHVDQVLLMIASEEIRNTVNSVRADTSKKLSNKSGIKTCSSSSSSSDEYEVQPGN